MHRRDFIRLIGVGPISGGIQSKLSKALEDLEIAARSIYGPIKLDLVDAEGETVPLIIYAVRD